MTAIFRISFSNSCQAISNQLHLLFHPAVFFGNLLEDPDLLGGEFGRHPPACDPARIDPAPVGQLALEAFELGLRAVGHCITKLKLLHSTLSVLLSEHRPP